MEETNYPFVIATDDEKLNDEQRAYLKKEYDLKEADLDELVQASLFRMSDYFRYYLFDMDEIAWSAESETYYSLGSFGPQKRPDIESVVAVVDENNECEAV